MSFSTTRWTNHPRKTLGQIPRVYPPCAYCPRDALIEMNGKLLCLEHVKDPP